MENKITIFRPGDRKQKRGTWPVARSLPSKGETLSSERLKPRGGGLVAEQGGGVHQEAAESGRDLLFGGRKRREMMVARHGGVMVERKGKERNRLQSIQEIK